MKQDIMIGTWAWGTGYGGAKMVFGTKYDEETLIAAFRKATELGFLNWDTAAVYGMGTCESLLGRLIHDRDDIFISTKYFPSSRFQSTYVPYSTYLVKTHSVKDFSRLRSAWQRL